MSRVEKCIAFMVEKGSPELRLIAGKPPVMKVGDGFKAMAKEALADQELLQFLMSNVQADTNELADESLKRWSIEIGGAGLTLTKRRQNGTLVLRVMPGEPSPAAEAATEPAETSAPPASAIEMDDASPAAAPQTAAPVGDEPRINGYFRTLVERGASDLHLSSDCRPYLRLDGTMVELEGEPVYDHDRLKTLLFEITHERNRKQFEEQHDADFAYQIDGLARFRCNLFMDRKGIGGVFRVIPARILTCDELGLSDAVVRLCYLSKGLVLVTGPTGSGKSTTLAALIDHINKQRTDHVITIEDPIEFVHDNIKCLINQREVHEHTMGFKNALRAALREDPDIVLVGEMRDLETISIAIETAETGHLVFGTLHTTTAVSTVDRIIDQFPPDRQEQVRVMLADSLRGVIAQTLCKKKDGGRVAALEVLLHSRAVANLIREGKNYQIPSVMQSAKRDGMITLNDSLLELVKRKQISADEAYIKSVDKESIRSLLQPLGLTIK